MAYCQSVEVTSVGPAQQLAKVRVFWESQHGPMPTRQKDGNVGGVISHGVRHKLRQAAGLLKVLIIFGKELLDCLIFSCMVVGYTERLDFRV